MLNLSARKVFSALLWISTFSYSYSQVEAPNYAPHHLGDSWCFFLHDGLINDTLTVTIITDSADEQGNSFIQYAMSTRRPTNHPEMYWFEYQKVDTAGNLYVQQFPGHWCLQYKADAQIGQRWPTGLDIDTAWVREIGADTLFGIPTTLKWISHQVGTEGYGEFYADKFGLVHHAGDYAMPGQLYLLAAKIGSTKYGDTTLTSVQAPKVHGALPIFQLLPNYPNPFNGATIIQYVLTQPGPVRVTVFDILGRQVETLVDANQSRGNHIISFESGRLSSGVYFYRLDAKSLHAVRKMVLQK